MLAAYRRLGAKGRAALTLRTVARRAKIPPTTLYRAAQKAGGWINPARRISPETKRQLDELLAARFSKRRIASELGIGEGSVSRRRKTLRERNGELLPGQWWRCPSCGAKIVVVRCQVCQRDRPAHVSLRDG